MQRTKYLPYLLTLLLSVAPMPPSEAADLRVIDVVQITWASAKSPIAKVEDVVFSISNQVAPSWKRFTTISEDKLDRSIEFKVGETLDNPIRIGAAMSCESPGFTRFMDSVRVEAYRQLDIESWSERYLIILTPDAGCIWSGRANLGSASSKGGVMVLHNTASAFVITHELGHNLGLGHSNMLRCSTGASDGPWSQTCKAVEYGGSIDVMGNVDTTLPISTYHQ